MESDIQPSSVAINNLLTMIQSQTKNMSSLIEVQSSLVAESLNNDVDEYNLLIEQCEALQEENATLSFKLNDHDQASSSKEQELETEIIELRNSLTEIKSKNIGTQQLRADLKALKELNPERLKSNLAETRKVSKERLESITKLRSDKTKLSKENHKLKKENSELSAASVAAVEMIEQFRSKLNFLDGNSVNLKSYKGADGLEFFIHRYGYPLSFRPKTKNQRIINDVQFHLELKSNFAICCIVSITDWLIPLFPIIQEFKGNVPSDLYSDLQSIYIDQMEVSHPYLIDRMRYFEGENIADFDAHEISERELKLLSDANYFSIYSIMHQSEDVIANNVKGMGIDTVTKIRNSIDKNIVVPWEKDHWTKEQIKKIRG